MWFFCLSKYLQRIAVARNQRVFVHNSSRSNVSTNDRYGQKSAHNYLRPSLVTIKAFTNDRRHQNQRILIHPSLVTIKSFTNDRRHQNQRILIRPSLVTVKSFTNERCHQNQRILIRPSLVTIKSFTNDRYRGKSVCVQSTTKASWLLSVQPVAASLSSG